MPIRAAHDRLWLPFMDPLTLAPVRKAIEVVPVLTKSWED
jgi:hypothetical protein